MVAEFARACATRITRVEKREKREKRGKERSGETVSIGVVKMALGETTKGNTRGLWKGREQPTTYH